jgi:DNA ligase-associated metallophosphoesterase
MDGTPIDWRGQHLRALPSGALFWPSEGLLVVADLHLGRSGRVARRGGTLLPPYETADTLDRLATEIGRTGPAAVIALGDSFDDDACATELEAECLGRLTALMAGRDWTWIAGNHDPAPVALGGTHRREVRRGPLVFRHAAEADGDGEVSGHWHPKFAVQLRAGRVSRPCFLRDARRLILPAFGTYTGGLAPTHPALRRLLAADATAILTGTPALVVPAFPGVVRRAGNWL